MLAYANACGALAAMELGAGMENLSETAVQQLVGSGRIRKGVTQGTIAA